MKKRILSILMLAVAVLGTASAKDEVVVVNNPDGSVETTTYSFNPHWFIQLQGGVQETLGEAKWNKLLSPTAQFEIGYQFSPVWALRLGASAWQSKGGWGKETTASYNLPNDGIYKWNYVAPALDVKFNLINAICGWKKDRVFSLNLIAGVGANFAMTLDDAAGIRSALKSNASAGYSGNEDVMMSHYREKTSIMPIGRFGLDLDFAVSQRVSLNLEGMANVLNDHYNGKHEDNADWYFNVLAGIKIALGKTVNKTVEYTPAPAPVVVEPEPEPEPVVVPEVVEPFQCNVFFKINKTVAEPQERAKVTELAQYMQKYPDCKVTLSGYADKGTGNYKINQRLSEGRVNYVADLLRNEYNIDADRIYTEFKGDTVQPFADNDSNRVTICITK